ncbi:MAG: hypothetical protein HSCHL_0669 [Hydrogenibacillus schlegelii]|uniref:Uncharacterized protein n=1 Tax=Hydrogenibacillus schlegelii TaxID=1484 RepID=A0A2T5G7W9_HYDSH|nr:MAG: hypothetical protein HSCHL_0669 [Hydrogenibacillus schlegelii]
MPAGRLRRAFLRRFGPGLSRWSAMRMIGAKTGAEGMGEKRLTIQVYYV